MNGLQELLITVQETSGAFTLELRRENGDVEKRRIIFLPLTLGDTAILLSVYGSLFAPNLNLMLDIIWCGIRRTGLSIDQAERALRENTGWIFGRGQVAVMFHAAQMPLARELSRHILAISGYADMPVMIRQVGDDVFATDLFDPENPRTVTGSLAEVSAMVNEYQAKRIERARPTAAPTKP